LTQGEADALLKLEKHYRDSRQPEFPAFGGDLRIPLFSDDQREEFVLSVRRGKIELRHNSIQMRARRTVILARVDVFGPPHRNPDDEVIACPHLHYYVEGFGDRWAKPLPDLFRNPENTLDTLDVFMDFCSVATKPVFLGELFA